MAIVIFDAIQTGDLVALFDKHHIAYKRIQDNNFRNKIRDSKELITSFFSETVTIREYNPNDTSKGIGQEQFSQIIQDCSIVIFHTGWVTNHKDANDLKPYFDRILKPITSTLKIVVSAGYQQEWKDLCPYIDWVGFHETCFNICSAVLGNSTEIIHEEKVARLIEAFNSNIKKKAETDIAVKILNSFLPLDIDMQALAILEKKSGKEQTPNDPNDYLKKVIDDRANYKQKFSRTLVADLAMNQGMEKLKVEELCNQFEHFLDKLQNQSLTGKPLYKELTTYRWGISDITSFHDCLKFLAKIQP